LMKARHTLAKSKHRMDLVGTMSIFLSWMSLI
jgi:hypothetical protein